MCKLWPKIARYLNYQPLFFLKNSLKITKNYFIIFLKVIRKEQASNINQSFICKHEINESNAEVATHY